MIDQARYRIAVDTGGTFTDVVVSNETGVVSVGKALTTYGRISDGLRAAIDNASAAFGMSGAEIVPRTTELVYGTTQATNAVVTGNTARTALLTTKGFADTLLLREGGRRNAFDSRAAYTAPYVPRHLTFEIVERVTAEGHVLTPLDEAGARGVIEALGNHQIEAVAVMLLWSISNDVHERRVGELIEEIHPGLAYTLSHRTNPSVREYRRASAAVIDASLKPLMRAHLRALRDDLEGIGFRGELMVVTSQGGVLDVDGVADRPIVSVNSGPSMAPLAGASFAPDAEVVVVGDMGGTTFDVSLVEMGVVRHTREAWIGEPFVGHLSGLSAVAVKSIGAGGGSIAWIDSGGLLQVGPQSAGSTPGPAAYGLGGERATITDAAAVLGYLDPQGFQGGFPLDLDRARDVVQTDVSNHLGVSVEKGSQAIFDVAVNHMASAIRQATLEEGVDPRGAVIVAGGGAGAMIAAALADVLQSDHVLIPRAAGVLAAYGAHRADIRTELSLPLFTTDAQYDGRAVSALFDELEQRAEEFFARFDAPADRRRVERFVDARYPAQAWELRVALPSRPRGIATEPDVFAAAFHGEHERRNGIQSPSSMVEFVGWGLTVAIRGQACTESAVAESGSTTPAPWRVGTTTFGGVAYETPRYAGRLVGPSATLVGPAVIDETTTTVVIPPGWSARVDKRGSFHVERIPTKGVSA